MGVIVINKKRDKLLVTSDVTIGALRVIDANANRTLEGLRVVEDFLRFVVEDPHLTEVCKQLRHDVMVVIERIPRSQLSEARDTTSDVGTTIVTDREYCRDDTFSVAAASFKRVQQSIRCLEEYAKILDPALGGQFEALRYRSYTLDRAVTITVDSRDRLANALLYILTDVAGSADDFQERVAQLLQAGADVIQLRDKTCPEKVLLERARAARQLTESAGRLLIVNDRPDLAMLADADGVHLGQDDLDVQDVRRILGPNRLIGISTHSLDQARRAALEGVNYIGVGPVFSSGTKSFNRYPGIQLLREIAGEIALPSFAIGGIGRDNLPQVIAAGFSRIAVCSAIHEAENPAALTAALRRKLDAS